MTEYEAEVLFWLKWCAGWLTLIAVQVCILGIGLAVKLG